MARDIQPFSYRTDPAVSPFPDDHPIIIYDGNCRMCSGFVRFILRHDRRDCFRFIGAQSPLGTALYRHYGLDPVHYETNILLEHGRPWLKSEGSIRMFQHLGPPWSMMVAGRLLPRSLRDLLYEFIARHRLRWFGVLQTCYLLEPGEESKFLG
jgi:predicted DCC family thiol-disulfide oxidoreductase YuxK